MKLGILFSGGKDSTYAAYLAKKQGNELACLITIRSENPDSYMFHTPSIVQTEKQAEAIGLPLVVASTKGEKEKELTDLKKAIADAKKKYHIEGIVTGALYSEYQASRIQKIANELSIKCINPLWHKDQIAYLKELVENKFEIIITGVAAYPLDQTWLGRNIDAKFISEVEKLQQQYSLNPAGEGGEFETFVLNCPLFKRALKVKEKNISGLGNAWRMEIKLD